MWRSLDLPPQHTDRLVVLVHGKFSGSRGDGEAGPVTREKASRNKQVFVPWTMDDLQGPSTATGSRRSRKNGLRHAFTTEYEGE